MKLSKISLLAITLFSLLVVSCSQEAKWKVKGNIADADGQLLTLERSLQGNWFIVDSARLDSKGSFAFEQPAAGYPDIYRLRVNDKTAYFPIDSIETVTLEGKLGNFSTGYTLSGSPQASALNEVNTLINNAISTYGAEAVNDENLKNELSKIVVGDMSSIVSYYVINKEIKGKRIFNPASKSDLRIIGAVVNAFNMLRPNDPRTKYLENEYLSWRRSNNPAAATNIEVYEVNFPEIELSNAQGKSVKLSSLVGNGKPVLVNFTAYAAEQSPVINLALADVYNAGGVDIYQVSVDGDEYLWREAARNIPWTAVHMSPRDGDKVLVDYNIGVIPTTYLIDKSGVLKERIVDLNTLPEIVKKYK